MFSHSNQNRNQRKNHNRTLRKHRQQQEAANYAVNSNVGVEAESRWSFLLLLNAKNLIGGLLFLTAMGVAYRLFELPSQPQLPDSPNLPDPLENLPTQVPYVKSLFFEPPLSPASRIETVVKEEPVKQFDDYTNLKLVKNNNDKGYHYTAKEKVTDRQTETSYTDTWYLVLRGSIFPAQVEKAMSKINQYFLGYAPDIEIVQDERPKEKIKAEVVKKKYKDLEDEPKFYIASREIRNFTCIGMMPASFANRADPGFRLDERAIHINNHDLQADGTFIRGTEVRTLAGLAAVYVLADFVGNTDITLNFGVQETEGLLRIFPFDNERALNTEVLASDLTFEHLAGLPNSAVNVIKLPPQIIRLAAFQKEMHDMLYKIATSDFSVIENILRRYITSTSLEQDRWRMKMFRSFMGESQWRAMQHEHEKKVADPSSKYKFGVDYIIDRLRIRHAQLQNYFTQPEAHAMHSNSLRLTV